LPYQFFWRGTNGGLNHPSRIPNEVPHWKICGIGEICGFLDQNRGKGPIEVEIYFADSKGWFSFIVPMGLLDDPASGLRRHIIDVCRLRVIETFPPEERCKRLRLFAKSINESTSGGATAMINAAAHKPAMNKPGTRSVANAHRVPAIRRRTAEAIGIRRDGLRIIGKDSRLRLQQQEREDSRQWRCRFHR
jgi:hypothetical protein